MHTLSLFPALFTFEIFAPTILRLIVSFFLIKTGWSKYSNTSERWLSLPFVILGVMIFGGLYTQLVSILALVFIKLDWWMRRKTNPLTKDQLMLYWFAGVILLSLMFTGPGMLAFDLPL